MAPIPAEDRQRISPQELEREALTDWRYVAGKLRARFATGRFSVGVSMVERIGAEADRADHHPDVDLRYGHLDIALSSHDVNGIARDVRLARTVSEIAASLGVASKPDALQVVALALDTADADALRPFWQAVLGLKPDKDAADVLLDPDGHVPGLFLQVTETHDEPRQRFHLDVDVPPEAVQDRIATAVAAGGSLVSDRHAPAWWTLADPEGNKVDIATWQGRD